jgi:TonB family protein
MGVAATARLQAGVDDAGDLSFTPVIVVSLIFHLMIFVGIPFFSKLIYHADKFDRPRTFTLVNMSQVHPLAQPKIQPVVQPKDRAAMPKPKTATTPIPKKPNSRSSAKKETKQNEETNELDELLSSIPTTRVSDMSVSKDFKFNWYIQNMQSRIEENFRPPMGLTDKQDASVVVSFTVFENGTISDIAVSRSSGMPALDNCAVAAVKESAPFGKLPLTFADQKLEPTVTLYYVKKQE